MVKNRSKESKKEPKTTKTNLKDCSPEVDKRVGRVARVAYVGRQHHGGHDVLRRVVLIQQELYSSGVAVVHQGNASAGRADVHVGDKVVNEVEYHLEAIRADRA